jgi:glucose-6-phosphate isomerase
MTTLKELLECLETEEFNGQLDGSFGKSYMEACRLGRGRGVGRLANLGFEESGRGVFLNRLGWTPPMVDWLLRHPDRVKSVVGDAERIMRSFRYVVFLGMGGSGLSVELVKEVFGEKRLKIFSLRTTDPSTIAGLLREMAKKEGGSLEKALGKTLVVAISKSGETSETVYNKRFFERLFEKRNIEPKEHFWFITDPGSVMEKEAVDKGIECRHIQLNGRCDIGGRFTSPTTSVFLLPLALTAQDRINEVLRQASSMNKAGRIADDVFVRLGAFLYAMALDGRDKVTLFVTHELSALMPWAEQLFEESLGKDGKGVSLFYGEKLSQGVLKPAGECDRVFVRINLGGKETRQGLWSYLSRKGYPVFDINVRNVNSLGGLMLGLQRAAAAAGYLWGIRFVDQPAVEGYKKETRRLLEGMKKNRSKRIEISKTWSGNSASFGRLKLYYQPLIESGALSRDKLQKKAVGMKNAAEVYAAILCLLKEKAGFEAAELASYGSMTEKLERIMEEARYSIYTKGLRMPCKLSTGPDKNHSYQQNIEDGRNMFFSTYFTYLQRPSAVIEGYDGNLLKASVVGTIKSMISHKRKVVLITVDSDAEGAERDIERFFREVERRLNSA